MSAATALYTPQVLALATSLSAYPVDPGLPRHGTARSVACGSTVTVGLALDPAGTIARIGLSCHACAIGQAATAIFAAAAIGTTRDRIAAAQSALAVWLGGGDELPDWPGLEAIATARGFPGRHGAILLPWKAALAALSTAPPRG
ncbi:MAG: iron-sulfur cluster assembly scaffold protein [Novosphingobium sp.]|nr:iron-sulfur cluster assembly scaffold protein [Novosphingobium sp.]